MAELSGILEGVGLPAITRFLNGLNKTGCLELTDGDWQGRIFFREGRITAANLGSRTGVDALDAMVEIFPTAQFAFDSNATPTDAPSIHLSHAELLERMDAIASRTAAGSRHLATPDIVPALVSESATSGDDPVPLDRGTLQTLLAVDGQRSVREIVRQRNTFDVLWQLAQLAEVGLVELGSGYQRTIPAPRPTSTAARPPAPSVADPARSLAPVAVVPPAPAPVAVVPPAPVAPAQPVVPPAPVAAVLAPEPHELTVVRCPRLGFEDDASSSFARATRLHRCFAASTPLPLSLDQQRELCLTDHFGTCPRLSPASAAPDAQPAAGTSPSGRIVRLPTAGRQPLADRPESGDPNSPTVGSGPRPLRAAAAVRANGAAAAEKQSEPRPVPTPLRARLQRTPATASGPATANGATASGPATASAPATVSAPATAAATVAPPSPVKPERRPGAEAPSTASESRNGAVRESRLPSATIPLSLGSNRIVPMLAVGVAVVLIAAAAYFVAPQVMSLFGGDTVDTSNLPNARLVEEGTPVSQIAAGRATPALPRAPAAQPTAASAAPDQPAPQSTPANASPAQSGQAPAASQSVANPAQPAVAPTTAAAGSPLFDETFVGNDANWPSNPQGAAQLTNGVYRVVTRQAGQFAAIGAPIVNVPSDVVVDATFRKLGGPPGGGYGIIVRNQDATYVVGANLNGHYYVMEAGDKGEVGMWRRDGDHWVDLLPWQHSDAVKPGTATNELSVRAVGNTLSLVVNGSIVAARTDATFPSGTVGLFAGGDGNQVAVSHFSIQNP